MNDYQKTRTKEIVGTIVKILFLLAFLFPFWIMFTTSFKTAEETLSSAYSLLPKKWTLEGFRYFFVDLHVDVWMYLKSSLIVAFGVVVFQYFIIIPAAYGFAKHDFYLSGPLFGLVLISFMMPTQVRFITVYMMFAKAKLMNTYIPQILPFIAYPFGIFLLRQSFKQVSDEIIESARLDNASEFKIMLKVVTPMAKATLVTIALFSFVSIWNAYFWPLVMTQSDKVRPLSLMVKSISMETDGISTPQNAIMAANLILVAPIMILYAVANKSILKSYGYKGVK